MLSAIVQRLHDLCKQFVLDQWLTTIDRCAAAYPDLQPWQVKKVCLHQGLDDTSHQKKMRKKLDDLYYMYLSQLLHPIDGHEAARRSPPLVKVRNRSRLRSVHI